MVFNWLRRIARRLMPSVTRRSRRPRRPGSLLGLETLEGRTLLSGVSVVTLSSASYAAREDAGAVSVILTRTGNLSRPVTVRYATADGTATAGSDYRGQGGTVRFAAGQGTRKLSIAITNDPQIEGDETFTVQLFNPSARDTLGGPSAAELTIHDDEASPAILLTPDALAELRLKAQDNTPQWQAFKARLDDNLSVVIADRIGSYQGEFLTFISDYALGYQVLKDSDPATAASYADKALGLMKSGLRDYQKGNWVARQFLARGNGVRRTFTLPNADLDPSTLRVFLSSVTTRAIRHGRTGSDTVGDHELFLKVSKTRDGAANYRQGRDWRHNPDLPNDQIDWSPRGKEPRPGQVYFVTVTSPAQGISETTAFTLRGRTITFHRAPRKGEAVFIQYMYGTPSPTGKTLAYQQTSAGDGGFNSIFIDTAYTARYLGKHLAMGLDWLDGYAGFSPALKTEVSQMLLRWSDYAKDNVYRADNPESNYAAGGYASRVMTALALESRGDPEGQRLLSEVLDYRQQRVVPLLTNPTTSLKGGFWAEGWNYGQLATENLLTAGLALETAGKVPAVAERHWANEVIEHLVSAQAGDSVYDGGDWYTYPAPFPGGPGSNKDLFSVLAEVADDADDRSYANFVLQNYAGEHSASFTDLFFRDPAAPASFWSALPLSHFASGTGLLTARSSWDASANVVAVQMGNLLEADHQSMAPGQLQIQRGNDGLLINPNALLGPLDPSMWSSFANVVVVDSHGDTDENGDLVQTYPFNMGAWYGNPGVTAAYEEADDHVYLSGDYHAAYSSSTQEGTGGPTSELTRQVVYLRPDYVVVYDRVTTLKDDYTKQLRWHFLSAPTVQGNAFALTSGDSKLFGQTFSTLPLSTTLAAVAPNPYSPDRTVEQLITQNTTASRSVRYLTAFQIAPSATAAMDAAQQILSADGRMEGVQIGEQVVLFGRDGEVDLATPVSYQVSGPARNMLVDLRPGQAYEITVDGSLLTTLPASARGTIAFTIPAGGTQTVSIRASS